MICDASRLKESPPRGLSRRSAGGAFDCLGGMANWFGRARVTRER
jgi:hypothetical protein